MSQLLVRSGRHQPLSPDAALEDLGWRIPARRLRGALAAVTAMMTTYALMNGLASGAVNVALAAIAFALFPTAQGLSRRIALNGALLVGWAPVLWRVRWPFELNHAAAIVSVVLGVLTFVMVAARQPIDRLRGTLPSWTRTDALSLGSVLVALGAMHAWVGAMSPKEALTVLLPGIDNVAHFQIFATMRIEGANLIKLGPAPDGGAWGFDFYPAAFHGLAATLSELVAPGLQAGPATVVAYAHAVAAVVVLGITVVTAAIVSLPYLEERFWIAAPTVCLTWSAFLWEPGQKTLADGFAPFWLGAAAGAVALLLSIDPRRPFRLARLASIAGLLLTILFIWPPLLVVAGPCCLVFALHAAKRATTGLGRTGWLIVATAAAGCLIVLLKVVSGIRATSVGFDFLVRATGGFTGTSPLPTFVLLVAGIYLPLAYPSLVRRWYSSDPAALQLAQRVRVLVLASALATVALTIFLIVQLHILGTTAYYFLKFMQGVELILAGFVPSLAAILVAMRPPQPGPRWKAVWGSLAVLAATQAFAPFPFGEVGLKAHPGGTASVDSPYSVNAMATGILKAATKSSRQDAFTSDYLALGRARAAQAFYPDAWYHAMSGTSTSMTGVRLDALRSRLSDADDSARAVETILRTSPVTRVIVAPAFVDRVRARMPSTALSRRVVSW